MADEDERSVKLAEAVSSLLDGTEGIENLKENMYDHKTRHSLELEYQGESYRVILNFNSGNTRNWIKVYPFEETSPKNAVEMPITREGDPEPKYFGKGAPQLANSIYRLVDNYSDEEY